MIERYLPAPLRSVATLLSAVSDRMGVINIGLVSAGVAFYSLLAVFPTMTAIIALWGLFADPVEVAEEVMAIEPLIPSDGFDIVEEQVNALASRTTSTLGWTSVVSLLGALWASRLGVAAIIGGLNKVHGCRSRGGVKHVATALSLSAGMILTALVALAAVVIAPVALATLPLGSYTGAALNVTRWTLGFAVVLFGVGALYRFGPAEQAYPPVWRRLGVITPGVLVAVALWGIVSLGFSTYLANFGNYDKVYGSLGAVIALLMWFYFSGFVVLLGAIFDVELARRKRGEPTSEEPCAEVEAESGSVIGTF